MNSQFLLAAAHSGAGKTTVTLGLLRAFIQKGHRVQSFKCGPDYIDPLHHHTAAGRESINLDRFMMSDDHIRNLYSHYGADADVCITEGVMGLFDGANRSIGSSADIAKLLGLPVVLVLDAKAMAYTAAALLYGLKNLDADVNIAGVLFNFVETETHYQLLCEACEDVGVKALGYLPMNKDLGIPSRHLGLDTANAGLAITAAADHMEKHIDLGVLLQATQIVPPVASPAPASATLSPRSTTAPPSSDSGTSFSQRRKILVARDDAFHFLYTENIRRLSEWGQVAYFSPMRDKQLPFLPDLLYLPGGYPELYLDILSENKTMLRQINTYAAANGRIIAECGGMMYLGRSIVDPSGKAWPMADVLDISTSMQAEQMTMGYRSLRLNGLTIKGHEFHFSQPVGDLPRSTEGSPGTNIEVLNARDAPVRTPVFYHPRLLAGYMHFYWGEETGLLEALFS